MRNRFIIEILERLVCEVKYDVDDPYITYVKSVIKELKEEELKDEEIKAKD